MGTTLVSILILIIIGLYFEIKRRDYDLKEYKKKEERERKEKESKITSGHTESLSEQLKREEKEKFERWSKLSDEEYEKAVEEDMERRDKELEIFMRNPRSDQSDKE